MYAKQQLREYEVNNEMRLLGTQVGVQKHNLISPGIWIAFNAGRTYATLRAGSRLTSVG